MFRPTSAQKSLLETEFLLPKAKADRLAKSWAEVFRRRVLPLINEEAFRDAFDQGNGRPNTSIRMLVGLHLLKEINDLTDLQVLDLLEYSLQWQYALELSPEQAHTCQKTMHNFRERLSENDRAQEMFIAVTKGLIEADGLRVGIQRIDSTQVISNIAVLTRLGLFCETVTVFLEAVRREFPAKVEELPLVYRARYLERRGYFADAKKGQAVRRLGSVAEDAVALLRRFVNDGEVRSLAAWVTLERLVREQCEVTETPAEKSGDEPGDGQDAASEDGPSVSSSSSTCGGSYANADGDESDGDERSGDEAAEALPVQVRVRESSEISGSSLQSPHDPDATYGHKGKGYQSQLTETCDTENPYQAVTAVKLEAANASDQAALGPILDQLEASGMAPEELLADTGYGSGTNIIEAAKRGVELVAPVQDPTPDDDAPNLGDFALTPTCDEVIACAADHAPQKQHLSKTGRLVVTYAAAHCVGCPLAAACPTKPLANGDRQLQRSPASIATELRQVEQRSSAFKERYKRRSGIESTNRELKYRHGMAKPRVRGARKMRVSTFLKVTAMNVKRALQFHVGQMAAAG